MEVTGAVVNICDIYINIYIFRFFHFLDLLRYDKYSINICRKTKLLSLCLRCEDRVCTVSDLLSHENICLICSCYTQGGVAWTIYTPKILTTAT